MDDTAISAGPLQAQWRATHPSAPRLDRTINLHALRLRDAPFDPLNNSAAPDTGHDAELRPLQTASSRSRLGSAPNILWSILRTRLRRFGWRDHRTAPGSNGFADAASRLFTETRSTASSGFYRRSSAAGHSGLLQQGHLSSTTQALALRSGCAAFLVGTPVLALEWLRRTCGPRTVPPRRLTARVSDAARPKPGSAESSPITRSLTPGSRVENRRRSKAGRSYQLSQAARQHWRRRQCRFGRSFDTEAQGAGQPGDREALHQDREDDDAVGEHQDHIALGAGRHRQRQRDRDAATHAAPGQHQPEPGTDRTSGALPRSASPPPGSGPEGTASRRAGRRRPTRAETRSTRTSRPISTNSTPLRISSITCQNTSR